MTTPAISLETRAVLAAVIDVLADSMTARELDRASAETAMERLVAALGADAFQEAIDAVRETFDLYTRYPRLLERAIVTRRKAEAAGKTTL